MDEKELKILILIKKFGDKYPKHKAKFDMIKAIEDYADVYYWHKKGSIKDILKKIKVKPDFIFHYDIQWHYGLAPKITDLDKVDIPKGCYVIDTHFHPDKRRHYFKKNKIDLIFSASKHPFFKVYPKKKYAKKFRWLPFAINPEVIMDRELKKDIKYLLLGQVYNDKKNVSKTKPGRYKFREAVLRKMKKVKGFVFKPHPGHLTPYSKGLLVNENYAIHLNRSKIFFTCGGRYQYPVLKFFEALGSKTLLLAEPNKDIKQLGFKDGVHFIACNKSNFYKKARYYMKKGKNKREKITNQGYEFVHKKHTIQVRAKQFVQYVEEYLKKRNRR